MQHLETPRDALDVARVTPTDHRAVGAASNAIADAYRTHDIPLPIQKVSVVAYRNPLARELGTVTAYGTRVRFLSTTWRVLDEPDGYTICINVGKGKRTKSIGGIALHELAHAINWEQDGVTYEGERNHATWLDRLDAPY